MAEAAILAVGSGVSAYAAYKEGQDKKYAYEMEAGFKRQQAAQVELAALREIDLTMSRADKVKNAQLAAFGSSGVAATSGSALMQYEETAASAFEEVTAIQQAAAYRKGTLLSEAGFSGVLGDQAEFAGNLGAAGSILTMVSKNPYSYDAPRIRSTKGNQAGGGFSSGGVA
jgi:hypothetical protein